MIKISTKQAAFLYLLNFNIEESGDEAYDDLLFLSRTYLEYGGYEADPGYDHDGGPLIEFPEGFDGNEWIMNPDFDDSANHENLHAVDPDDTWKGFLKAPIQKELSLLFDAWKDVHFPALLERIEEIQ